MFQQNNLILLLVILVTFTVNLLMIGFKEPFPWWNYLIKISMKENYYQIHKKISKK